MIFLFIFLPIVGVFYLLALAVALFFKIAIPAFIYMAVGIAMILYWIGKKVWGLCRRDRVVVTPQAQFSDRR